MITAVATPPFPHVAVSPGCCTACQLLKLQLHLAAAIATAAAAAVALADRCTCLALCAPCGRQGICSKILLALACSMAGMLQQELGVRFMNKLCMVRHAQLVSLNSTTDSCVRNAMHKTAFVTVVG